MIRPLLAAGLLLGFAQAEPRAAFERLSQTQPGAKALWRAAQPTPSLITGLRIAAPAPEPAARAFFQRHPELFAPRLLLLERKDKSLRFQQQHEGLPVLEHELRVVLKGGHIVSINNQTQPLRRVQPARIDEARAKALARAHLKVGADHPVTARKVVLATGDQGVEAFEVHLSRMPLAEHLVVRVDAHAGTVLGVQDRVIR